ncbi:MAG: four helix bundle protein [Bacteroidota bacterium]
MDYKNLEIWKKSVMLVDKIYDLTESFPEKEKFRLIDQMCRAAISVPSNFAEGIGRQYKNETKQFLYISRGSLFELETQIHIASLRKCINKDELESITIEVNSCKELVQGFINYVNKSKGLR